MRFKSLIISRQVKLTYRPGFDFAHPSTPSLARDERWLSVVVRVTSPLALTKTQLMIFIYAHLLNALPSKEMRRKSLRDPHPKNRPDAVLRQKG